MKYTLAICILLIMSACTLDAHPFWGIVTDGNRNIDFADIGVDDGVLVMIDREGNSRVIAKNLISKPDRPRDKHYDILLGMTKGPDGLIYIAENAGQRIIRIPDNGEAVTFYRSDGGWFPSGICFSAGDAFILEFKHAEHGMEGPRITMVGEYGNKREIFNYETGKE